MTKKKAKNSMDSATHHVVIDFEDGREQEVFDAIIDFSDDDTRLYKLVDDEPVDDTYIEIREDEIVVVVDDDEIEVDVLDFKLNGASIHLSCEEFDCLSVEIDAQCICDNQEDIAQMLTKTPPFGIDTDDPYAVLFEMMKYQE